MTNFGDLKTDSGVTSLNDFLAEKSYMEGYFPSQSDVSVFESLGKPPSAKYCHALRWYNHILSFGSDKGKFPAEACASTSKCQKSAPPPAEEDDDDVDLFGSDDEEDEGAAKVREERIKAYAEKKTKKPGPIAKSQILLDCKPWDDETDMKEMEGVVRSISMDGLTWGASKLNPLAFGINKLSILCTVIDDLVSVDDLIEKITEYEDFVQSVDIAAFNKV